MMFRRRFPGLAAAAALMLALSFAPTQALAFGGGTPDTDPPAEEQVCNAFGGRARGLCVAYWEAQDCPASEHPSCEVLRRKMYDLVGSEVFPCDSTGGGGFG